MLRRNLRRQLPPATFMCCSEYLEVYLDLGPEMGDSISWDVSQPEGLRGHVSECSDHRHPSFVSFMKHSVP